MDIAQPESPTAPATTNIANSCLTIMGGSLSCSGDVRYNRMWMGRY